MGIGDKQGSLVVYKDADIVVFDKDIEIDLVMVGGNVQVNKL